MLAWHSTDHQDGVRCVYGFSQTTQSSSMCVLRAKQQDMCLLLWLMKCHWFGVSSRDTGCEKHSLFMFGCRRRAQAAGWCCVSSHPDGFTQLNPPIITSPGRHLFEEHPEDGIYMSDIFSAKPLICSCFVHLCWMSTVFCFFLFFFTFVSAWWIHVTSV